MTPGLMTPPTQYVPPLQSPVGATSPGSAQYRPAGHAVQSQMATAPGAERYVPLGHAYCRASCVPAGQ